MTYLDAQELPVPALGAYEIGRYGRYEIVDAAAVVHAWSRFRRADGPVLGPWLKGDRALFWWRDPLPAVGDVWQRVAGRRPGRALGRLRRAVVRRK